MRVNFKQTQLIEELVSSVKEKFPEVDFVDVTESPENPNDLWVNVTEVEDEDREIELIKFCGGKASDILTDYGYHILVMPIKERLSDAVFG